ncbi:MAG: 7-cyano-7-deazaguanine synthase [Candidatus Diapherotrites archaeon]|nr:7-cyano-7-deazaguanine synthase [Candidatus Diapherotrites archaeon]
MAKARALLLLSGGIDSPVAGFLAGQKAEIIALHFSNKDFAGEESIEKSRLIAKRLKFKKFIVLDLAAQLKEIAEKCDQAYYFVLQRRLFFRVAEKVAEKEKCDFICTGDSLGQVSSQTLSNMAVISRTPKKPIARPLLGFDKLETTRIAEKIGTLETSKGPEMCDVLGPKHPSTHARLERVLEEEKKIDLGAMAEKAVLKG